MRIPTTAGSIWLLKKIDKTLYRQGIVEASSASCRSCRRRPATAFLAFAVVGAAGVGTLEYSARLRLGDASTVTASRDLAIDVYQILLPQALSSIGDTVSSDTRPKLWLAGWCRMHPNRCRNKREPHLSSRRSPGQ